MEYLYKLEDGNPVALFPNIISPSQEQITSYGQENGGKTLMMVSQSSEYYNLSYVEDETTITEVWTPFALEDAKIAHISKIKQEANQTEDIALYDYTDTDKELMTSNNSLAYVQIAEIKGITQEEAQAEIIAKKSKFEIVIGIITGHIEILVSQIDGALTVDDVSALIWDEQTILNEINTKVAEL